MEILFYLLFLIVGLGLGWFIGKLAAKNNSAAAVSADVYQHLQKDFQELDKEKVMAMQKAASLMEEKLALQGELQTQRNENLELTKRISNSLAKFEAQEQRLIEQKQMMEERLQEQRQEVDEAKAKLTMHFENIAHKLLEEKTLKFTEHNRSQLDIVLSPFKEKLQDFEKKVEAVYKEENNERITLKSEIKHLMDMNKQLSEEANNLTKALKGDNKKQGNWGELILERVLETSGLEKGREYSIQHSAINSENSRIQPDVVIYLPDNKHIIIDSKVSLDAYEQYHSCTDDVEKEIHAKKHLESLRTHIKGLGEKKYQTAENLQSLDFILLFVPIESSFSLAIKLDEEIFNFAWKNKIVIVSPTTLLATLKTISSIWKYDRLNRNTQAIAKEGAALYDKFMDFLKDMDKINKALNGAQEAYNDAHKKLIDGRGNLIRQTDKLKKLGAKTNKEVPLSFSDALEGDEDLSEIEGLELLNISADESNDKN